MLLLAGVGWVYYDLARVRSDVTSARDSLVKAFADPGVLRTPEGRAATHAKVEASIRTLDSAGRRAAASHPISAIRLVPGGGTQRSGLLNLIRDATVSAAAVRDLLDNIDRLAGQTTLEDGRVPSEGLAELSRQVRAAAATIRASAHARRGLWGPLKDASDRFQATAESSSDRLERGADAITAARTFMGADSDRRYLLALMNNAEMRDQGMVLSYAVVHFVSGRIVFEKSGSVQDLFLDRPAPTEIPAGTKEVFGAIEPTRVWQSVNATADFAWTGRALRDMYAQKSGQPVDGVIGVDVPGTAAVLRSIGPVAVAGVAEPIDAANLGRIVLHDFYEGLTYRNDQSERRELLGDVTHAVVDNLIQGRHDVVGLGRELGEAAKGGHLRLWSSYADEERVFERSGIGGGPASSDADRTFHLAVENRTATKLDYYVKPSVRQDVQLHADGSAVVRTTVVIDNQAPQGAAPSYQLGPDEFTEKPGDYRAWALLWGPAGASQAESVAESGLVLSQHVVPVSAGNKVEVSFETVVPHAVRDGRLKLRLVPQSRLEPMPLEVRLRAPGWRVEGESSLRGSWDRTWLLEWKVSR